MAFGEKYPAIFEVRFYGLFEKVSSHFSTEVLWLSTKSIDAIFSRRTLRCSQSLGKAKMPNRSMRSPTVPN